MNFVNVVSSRSLNDLYEQMAVNVTKNTLISLISGFHQQEFGLNTLQKVKKQIKIINKLILILLNLNYMLTLVVTLISLEIYILEIHIN
jgi:hypothetical protein